MGQIDEDDLEDLWKHYQKSSKEVYQGPTRDGWCDEN